MILEVLLLAAASLAVKDLFLSLSLAYRSSPRNILT